jgi:hypothetical protein
VQQRSLCLRAQLQDRLGPCNDKAASSSWVATRGCNQLRLLAVTKRDFAFVKKQRLSETSTEEKPKFIPVTERAKLGHAVNTALLTAAVPVCLSVCLLYLQEKNVSGNSHAVCQRPTAPRRANKWRPPTTISFFFPFLPLPCLYLFMFFLSHFPFPLLTCSVFANFGTNSTKTLVP